VTTTPVTTYLSLLFLSHRGVVRLQQDDLFGDLWVQNPEAVDADDAGDDGVETEEEEEAVEAIAD
jgi:segregation and condensation protein A